MEGGIFLCHWYFLLKAYLQKRRGQATQDQTREDPDIPKSEEKRDIEASSPQHDIPLNPVFSSTSPEVV